MLSYDAYAKTAVKREIEYLPFTLRLVHDEASLIRAVGLRQEAYARHMPDFAAKLTHPEASDTRSDVVILLAESKLDGVPLSTMRIQTNAQGPLMLEDSLPLPNEYRGRRLAEATRLGVAGTREGQLAKRLMFKAYFLLCLSWGVDRMVITARRPLDRQYEALTFSDVVEGAGYVPMKHVGDIPHRVLDMDVPSAETVWRAIRHPMTRFVFDTDHPDLDITPPAIFGSPGSRAGHEPTPLSAPPVQSPASRPRLGPATLQPQTTAQLRPSPTPPLSQPREAPSRLALARPNEITRLP